MDMMERHRMLLDFFGGDKMKLVHTHTISTNYTETLDPLYSAEIKPYLTFGDYKKICIVVFENNTYSGSGKINVVFFSMGVELSTITSYSNYAGGMIRNDYTNLRDLVLSNDAKCSSGTVIKIYEAQF